MWADYILAHHDPHSVHSFLVFPIRKTDLLRPPPRLAASFCQSPLDSPRVRGIAADFAARVYIGREEEKEERQEFILGAFEFRSMRVAICLLLLGVIAVNAQRRLSLPDPRSCANRVRHASYRDARGVTHSYFFSWEHLPTRSLEVDWLDARNICRRHCMDAVSLETPQENEFIKQRIARGNVRYIWTSGRKCNFNGCDRPDLQPQNVNGWFWSGSGAKIGATSQRNSGDWSQTGGYGQPQPDNREAAQGNDESCLSILNNFYNDGIKWHDVACHHVKPFVCEDSDELLNFVASRNPGIRL
ncbi:hypothetical protein KPH14_005839 [Odynerus spinipes]|uniref:C-type lectin domain-containing protein n=1 Tax=Odynerus spinipes TaxID=1348599 RepID=A0AAD9RCI2_9HYME|nr:hypothetical protein KPH14_005839 [Odynerus spinipes]